MKYEKFDNWMIALIKSRNGITASTLTSLLKSDATPLTKPGEEFRAIDRRLQALRKKGLIAWKRRGTFVEWHSIEAKDASA